jgi:uncharacterized protein involved in response to NO
MQQFIQIPPSAKKASASRFALFDLGFRPFFLLASAFAAISIAAWMWSYLRFTLPPLFYVTASQWHAHEMLYGFAFAVIAGFLLTAVKNWTGRQTLQGLALAVMLACWAGARAVMLLAPDLVMLAPDLVMLAALLDLLFNLWLMLAIARPIVKVKQWRQLGVLAKVAVLTLGNAAFYAQALGWSMSGAYAALWIGLLLNVSLILAISRRILPGFIERGVQEQVTLKNMTWLDRLLMLSLVVLLLNILTADSPVANMVLGLTIATANSLRLFRWHTPGLWRVPLLWSFYSGLWLITAGFFLYALSFTNSGVALILAIHCWAIGGIAVITLAMMARVALGHTGRNIHQPPASVAWTFALVIAATLSRVFLPLLWPEAYRLSVMLAATFWIVAFIWFCITYWPILSQPRIDGTPG